MSLRHTAHCTGDATTELPTLMSLRHTAHCTNFAVLLFNVITEAQ